MAEHKSLWEAFAAAKAEMGAIPMSGVNPHFKSRYVPLDAFLEAVSPVCEKHGLLFLQPTAVEHDMPGVKNVIVHVATGENFESFFPIVLSDNPQKVAASLTYARRTSGLSFWGVAGDTDDDAEATQERSAPASSDNPNDETFKRFWKALKDAFGDASPWDGTEAGDAKKVVIEAIFDTDIWNRVKKMDPAEVHDRMKSRFNDAMAKGRASLEASVKGDKKGAEEAPLPF